MDKDKPDNRNSAGSRTGFFVAALLGGLLALPAVGLATTQTDYPHADDHWRDYLRQQYFQDRPIADAAGIIKLKAPQRAEDAAVVPLRIKAQIPQQPDRYIKNITLLVDHNPKPLAGTFHFTPASGRASLAVRVRLAAYSPVRVIAETNDGKLYMAERFVKASGGCSAPISTDLDKARAHMGEMRFRVNANGSGPVEADLAIHHPNTTGMQMNQLTRLVPPAHYVKQIHVRYNDHPVFSGETDISISQNPNFRFYYTPEQAGELSATVVDSNGKTFKKSYHYQPHSG